MTGAHAERDGEVFRRVYVPGLRPGTRYVITHRHKQHDREPEDRRDDDELRALWSVFAVHEEKYD